MRRHKWRDSGLFLLSFCAACAAFAPQHVQAQASSPAAEDATASSAPGLRVGGETESQQVAREEQAPEPDVEMQVEALPGDPWGDADGLSVISIRALLQARYVTTFAEESHNERLSYRVREEYLAQNGDGWGINRMLVRLSSDPLPQVGFKAVLDFSELMANDPEDVLKQAYATLRPVPGRLEFVVGLFKLPYATLELDPSSRFELADLGPANRLIGNLGYAGRDLGVQMMASPLKKVKRLRVMLGAFRGHAYDEHDFPAGVVAARVEVKPIKPLRFGLGYVDHLRATTYDRPFNTSDKDVVPNPVNPLYPAQKRWGKGRAFGADVRFKKKGFMARGEFLYGDRVDTDARYGAQTFWAAWGLAAYRIDLGKLKLLPAVRAEWLDVDRDRPRGLYRTLSAGLTLLFWERVRLLFDATRTDVGNNTPVLNQPKPLQEAPYLALDNTRFTAQLQVEL